MNKKEQQKLDILSNIDEEIIERNSVKRFRLMKRMQNAGRRKRIRAFSSIAACLLAVLIGVFVILQVFVKQVPVYRGMTISSVPHGERAESSVDGYLMLDASGSLPKLNALFEKQNGDGIRNDGDEIDQNDPFGHGGNQRPVEEVVEDSLQIEGAAKEIYYAQPNEDIYITIHIDNPDSFEILSFTLNGKKYSSYMFEDGSDLENLILKVNVGDAEGIVEYTIDAIKYVDGTEIKDVRMDGDKTVRAGVATKKQPVSSVTNETVGLYAVAFDVTVNDPISLISKSFGSVQAVLYNGEEIIAAKELEVGKKTHVEFKDLSDGTLYQYAIVANYDALDGSGFGSYALTKKAFYTNTYVAFDAVTVSSERVTFAYVWDGTVEERTITALALYQNGNKVRDLDTTVTEVLGLLSDTEYTLVASYQNRGEWDTVSVTFKTEAKSVPKVTVSEVSETQTGIVFAINETDTDNVGSLTKIELLHGDDIPVVAKSVDVRSFEGLLSNNAYTVRVSYVYDLNDGKGAQTVVKTLDIKTQAKATPQIDVTAEQSSSEGIKGLRFEISENDTDEVGRISNITLTDSKGAVVHTGDTEIRSFNGLTLKETYTVTVSYNYDLNDGKGIREIQDKTSLKILPDMNTPYTVKHYLQNVNDDGYTLYETESLTGEEQANVTPVRKSYDGFTAPDAQTKQITWDGSTVIEYHYTRNSYTVTYISNGGSEHAQVMLRYGQDIPLPTPTRDGYTFGGWFTDVSLTQAASTLPIGGVILYARWAEETATSEFNFTGSTEITITKLKSDLTDVVIPAYIGGAPVTGIGDHAFSDRKTVTSVKLPTTVKSIGMDAFEYCEAMTAINLPDGLTSIGYQAFCNCSALTSIDIPDSVTSLGERSFYGSGLKNVTIPGSIKTISYFAFGYTNLTSVVISEGVETIDRLAFYNSYDLARITIPSSVTKIDEDAFFHCNIETFYYQGTLETWCRIEFVNEAAYPVSYDNRTYFGDTLLSTMTELVIPDSITEIKDYTFFNWSHIKTVTIPNGVTSIGNHAFQNCYALQALELSSMVTNIGDYAFEDCDALTTLTLPNGLQEIGEYAFYHCSALSELTISESVTKIGDKAFAGCENLTHAIIPCFAISYLPGDLFVEVVLTSGTSISAYAFEGCSNLTTLVIPDSVTDIGENVFLGCTSFANVYYCGTATEWKTVTVSNIGNNALTSATVYCYSETEPTDGGNYWRYVDGVPTAW